MDLYTVNINKEQIIRPMVVGFFRTIIFYIALLVISRTILTTHSAYANLPKTTNIKFQNYDLDDGLLLNTVNCITQDADGFLWVTMQGAGVGRFDGYEFKYFKHESENPSSLSDSWVHVIYMDKSKRLWFGTRRAGLNLYDPKANRFTHYYFSTDKSGNVKAKYIKAIIQDKDGIFWIGTRSYGLIRFDFDKNSYEYYSHNKTDENSLSHNEVTALYEDSLGRLWIGTQKGGLNLFHHDKKQFEHFRHSESDNNTLSNNFVQSVNEDRTGNIWVATENGLNRINMKTSNIIRYVNNNKSASINSNDVRHIMRDSRDQLWFSTGDGVNIYDEASDQFISYRKNPFLADSLSAKKINMSLEDSSGNIWIASQRGGIYRYSRSNQLFQHITSDPNNPGSLLGENVFGIIADDNDELWVGTVGGGLNRYDSKTNTFKHYKPDPNDPYSISGSDVTAIHKDHVGDLWIGTYNGGLNRYDKNTGKFYHYKYDENDISSLGHNFVITIFEDRQQNIWVGTHYAGLHLLDRNTGKFRRYQHELDNPDGIASNQVWGIYEDSDNNLWIGTGDSGLDLLDRQTGKFIHYRHSESNTYSISHNTVTKIFEDSLGKLWIGTAFGLNYFDYKSGKFRRYFKKDGLASDIVFSIDEGEPGSLWISGNKGLSHFDINNNKFSNYDVGDGLQSNEFNNSASFKLANGELLFGGVNGFNIFNPKKLQSNNQLPKVVITNFLLFNKAVELFDNSGVDNAGNKQVEFTLENTIESTKNLTLSYRESFFSFDFSALHYVNVKKNQYAYQLKGWDKEWIYTDYKIRRASYTNIPAGEYVFHVKASNNDGVWNHEGASIAINILPPPWKTWWAYFIYGIVVLVILFILWQWIVQKQRAEREHIRLQKEKEVTNRLQEIDKLKDDFLANTSHELRTPLNGIIGLSEILLDCDNGTKTEEEMDLLRMISFSGKRLSHLINDILDFSKLKNKTIELQCRSIDLYSIGKTVLTLLSPLVDNKDVVLINNIDDNIPLVYADENRLQQILYNLLGNAIKFTANGAVELSTVEKDKKITISIKDSGIGISKDKYEKIFESFEQADSSISREYAGTGLGLAVSKKLVNLHGSDIYLESEPGQGSIFSFELPVSELDVRREKDNINTAAESDDVENDNMILLKTVQKDDMPVCSKKTEDKVQTVNVLKERYYRETAGIDNSAINKNNDVILKMKNIDTEFSILIVDDEDVNRQVLRGFLQQYNYTIVEADNGYDVMRMFENDHYIDLVLLDIMMPRISGFEVCENLRKIHSREELPILFLSAINNNEESSEAFKYGCNDYLRKPVSKQELLIRVQTQLDLLVMHRSQKNAIHIT